MKTLLCFLSFLSFLQCVTSEIRLVESGPGTVKPSEALNMVCTVTGASLTDAINMHCVSWIRDEGGKLVWLAAICYENIKYYASSLQDRMTLTRDTDKGEVYFKLTGMKAEESGRYHCARHAPRYWAFDIWGAGQGLLVTSASITHPVVFPLIPYDQQGKSEITVGCLVLRYIPMPATVDWSTTSGVKLSGELNVHFPLSGNPPTYTSVSSIAVSSLDWEKNSYRCDVTHYSSKIQKTIPKGCTPFPEEPAVQLLQHSCPSSTSGQTELTCLARNLTVPEAIIKWFVNGKEVNLPQQLVQMGKSIYFSMQSSVSISLPQWNRGDTVGCQVTDTKTGKSTSRITKKCSDNYNCLGIKIKVVNPTTEDLYFDNMAHIGCVALNLKVAYGYEFQWSSSEDISQANIQTEDPQLNEDGTYSVLSTLSVSSAFWLQHKECVCTFKMPGLSEPIVTRISKKKEPNLRSPKLTVYAPSAEEISMKAMCSITCNAIDFCPGAIYMSWKQNQKPMSPDDYVISHPKQISGDGNPRYYVSSIARIPCSKWEDGTVYDCIAAHEATPLTFTRKSIDKNSGCCQRFMVEEDGEDTDSPWDVSATFVSLFLVSLIYSVTVTLFKVK